MKISKLVHHFKKEENLKSEENQKQISYPKKKWNNKHKNINDRENNQLCDSTNIKYKFLKRIIIYMLLPLLHNNIKEKRKQKIKKENTKKYNNRYSSYFNMQARILWIICQQTGKVRKILKNTYSRKYIITHDLRE